MLKLRAAFLRLGLLGWQGVLLAGCAGAPRPAEVPPAAIPATGSEPALPPTLNLTELESLEHDLRESEARLDAELARKREVVAPAVASEAPENDASPTEAQKPADSVGSGRAGPSAGAQSGVPRPEPAQRPRAAETESGSPPDADERGSPCDLGCRALASMQRAQLRICELAGPGERCQGALARVQAAAERVRQAGCECLPSENR